MFRSIPKTFDVPELEHEVMKFWKDHDIERRYLERNRAATERFAFLDGPITANGPMGVHHAWGRTYKDLWQRYHTMLGKKQRYQNGFDCQGLWVEVTVERELGFTSKRDIESYGIAEFVRKCKENVYKFAGLQSEQSRRMGYFMDWDTSYYTLSDENNYTIWYFLKRCHERGLIYKGRDVMPWCTRCGTGLSEHEIATDGYQDLTHRSVYMRFPLANRADESLLVWTTTPWTLTSNVAVAVKPELRYVAVRQNGHTMYVAKGALHALRGEFEALRELPGQDLIGLQYKGPFDELPAAAGVQHVVIPWDDVTEDEGTGLVHIAPGCGKEDFALSKEFDLAVIAPLDQNGVYGDGFGWLTGRSVQDVAAEIIADLEAKGNLYYAHDYTHRYPTCWRCGTELVFRLVDEWFIAMDPLRADMMEVVRQIRWIPSYGLERELDWLRNMDDWMISKKRYWGLALPFWICPEGHLEILGGKTELFERALGGLEHLESPHRPWIDEVTIECSQCGQVATRILDVGNPWLDAGIVPYSTLRYDGDRAYWQEWFPADFITESFPGQFRNWFYSMIAMSTVLENTNPFQNVLGYQLVRDQNGREMHKSWGNLIPFDEAADRAGADIMRWLFCLHSPETNVNFGWESLDETKRRLLVLWNTLSFFVTYANVDRWRRTDPAPPIAERPLLDRWILARLHQVIGQARGGLDDYDAMNPARAVERFIEDLSTWYVRRSRRRFWKAENDTDKVAGYATLYTCLETVSQLIAPFMPFLAETVFQTLVADTVAGDVGSVHLSDYPSADVDLIDVELLRSMATAQQLVALGRAARDRAAVPVRQPLSRLLVRTNSQTAQRDLRSLQDIILEELNVKELEFAGPNEDFVSYSIRPNLPSLGPRFGKQMPAIRSALEALEPADVASSVSAGLSISLSIDGSTLELAADDVLVTVEERPGYAAIAAHGLLVALDTEITPPLWREGMARQVVRRINDGRRSAGLSIEDRIRVRFESGDDLAMAIDEHAQYVQQETLALSIERGELGAAAHREKAEFGGQSFQFELERAE